MNKKKKLRPLKHYINNKEEMINQVFSCISEKQIKKMTPNILQEMSIDELKAECLVQLLTLSNTYIINILEGRKYYTKEDGNAIDENIIGSKRKISESSQASKKIKSDEEDNEDDKHKNNTSFSSSEGGLNISKKKRKEKKHKSGKKIRKSTSVEEEKQDDETKGKNLLELLELEMRAKAIRSLLKQEDELEKLKDKNEKCKTEDSCPKKKDVYSLTKTEITKVYRKEKRKPKIKSVEDKKLEEKVILQQICKDKEEKIQEKLKTAEVDHYDWNAEEEKLIYEDDEYESDENLENETESKVEMEKQEDENNRSSWAERWLQSKDVKRVVATSKMLTTVRNKMKNKATNKQLSPTRTTPPNLEGSVKEYDTLLQMKEAVESSASTL